MFRRFWHLISESFRIWGEARASQMSAALTYYTMLSLAPTLVIAIAIAGYLFDDGLAKGEILTTVEQFTTPEIAETIAGLIKRAQEPKSGAWAGTISVCILVIGASGVFSQLYETFNHIWSVSALNRSFWFSVRKRLIGIAMVLLVGLFLIAALVTDSVVAYLNQLIEGHPMLLMWFHLADRSLSYLLMPIVFSVMFWSFPATQVVFRDVIPAGVITSVLIGGSQYFIQLYLQFSKTSEVYGAAGSLVVMLIWIYITGMVVFFGAAFSCAWSNIYGARRELATTVSAIHDIDSGLELPSTPLVPQRRDGVSSGAN